MTNRLASLTTIAALCMATPVLAAENESTPLAATPLRIVAMAPAPVEGVTNRPQILPVLYATYGVMQAWDIYSTTAALKAGATERNPIAAPVAANPASLIALKAVSTAGTIYFTERIWKNNRVAAVIVLAAINGATAAVSLRNMRNTRAGH
jgi:hypothetical protein